ncbi:MAG TPA: alpha/beta hydrolase domain-containing protein [Burkholderiales bacterium]|jgi:hypothetical protein
MRSLFSFLLACAALVPAAQAEVTRLEITSTAPFAGGKSFGAVGPYVRVTGRFYGELDPSHPANRAIVDLRSAPRNARGKVEYSADFDILRPADAMKGNGTLIYDVNNRGNKRIIHLLNDTPANNALDTPESAGDGFLMRQGFSIAWSGWIPANPRSFPPAPNVLRLEVPNAPGLEQPVWDEFLFNNGKQLEGRLTFPAASLDKAKAQLTVRERNDAAPKTIPRGGWDFRDDGAIVLLPSGTPFREGALYQFSYRAKNPPVSGIGYAATRDWIGFLRYQQRDGAGTANPLGEGGRHKVGVALAHGTSQSGRFLRDMLYNGFNETEDLRIVFDGLNPHIASARLFLNYRFAQANRIYSIGYGSLGYPDASFPFAYEKLRDPKSLREDGLLERCRKAGNCPKILQTVSSTEYWQGAHSLNTTDPLDEQDIALPGNVRIYHFAGTEHVITATMPKGVCAAPANTWVDPRPAMRALVLALDRWVKTGAPPPASVYPRIADGTLVPASSLKWPAIPASGTFTFTAPRSPNPLPQFDYGARFADGIIDTVPPAVNAFRYKVLVPAIDADGNEIAGLRLPEQAVPAATTTGWSVRSGEGGAAGELCYLDGIALPFARTAAEREAAKDPRLSLAERYQDKNTYLSKVRTAAQDLVKRGFYLEEDVEKTVERAARAW